MSALVPVQALETQLAARLGGVEVMLQHGELTLEVARERWVEAARVLRDEFGFEQCVDLCGVDFMGYGADEWDTQVSSHGFSRGVEGRNVGRFKYGQVPTQQAPQPEAVVIEPIPERRFAVVAHLLSIRHNQRLRLRTFCTDDALPRVDSLITIWPGVDWFEREAFDMFGVVFDGHPDLRRILTDYGFVGHPFRKDFPLIGNVEVRYDAGRQRIVYEPVTSVEPRVGVPRVVREDARQLAAAGEAKDPVKPAPRIGPADAWANRGTP